MKKLPVFILSAITVFFFFQSTLPLHANDGVKKKAKEVMNDTSRGAAKATRTLKDKSCEMLNSKMECAAQKVKHKIQDGADVVEDVLD